VAEGEQADLHELDRREGLDIAAHRELGLLELALALAAGLARHRARHVEDNEGVDLADQAAAAGLLAAGLDDALIDVGVAVLLELDEVRHAVGVLIVVPAIDELRRGLLGGRRLLGGAVARGRRRGLARRLLRAARGEEGQREGSQGVSLVGQDLLHIARECA
jgi:hypothetical protein